MNRIRIVYATMTKHSKKLAEAMGQALNVKAQNVKESPDLKDADLLFIVGGIYSGESLPELLEYVNNLDGQKIKRAALVTSCVSKKKGQDSIRVLLTEKGIEVVDEIICQGSFLFMGFGHPNKVDVNEVVHFAKSLAERVGETA